MKKAIITILILTFIGSYGTFKVIKLSDDSAFLYDIKYYNVFIPYKKEISIFSQEEAFIDSAIIGFTNQDIGRIRPIVLLGTLIAFLLSLYPAFRIYKKENVKNDKNWVLSCRWCWIPYQ